MLADGTYDAVVIDATEADDALVLELALTAGPHKGEIVSVRAAGFKRDPVMVIGLPATLTVAGGRPAVQIDD